METAFPRTWGMFSQRLDFGDNRRIFHFSLETRNQFARGGVSDRGYRGFFLASAVASFSLYAGWGLPRDRRLRCSSRTSRNRRAGLHELDVFHAFACGKKCRHATAFFRRGAGSAVGRGSRQTAVYRLRVDWRILSQTAAFSGESSRKLLHVPAPLGDRFFLAVPPLSAWMREARSL